MTDNSSLTRRAMLRDGVTAMVVLTAGSAWAGTELVEREIARRIGAAKPIDGRVTLDLPSFAQNGGMVPLTVRVESPMTETDHVESIHVFAEGNPMVMVGAFHFTPDSGKAEFATRIRLAKSQDVIAVAKMNDGKIYRATANIDIAVSGCDP
jgi:sulfur-oxidizing protein SoxY